MLIKEINTGLSETDIENFLCKEVKKLGGVPYKFTSPNRRSVPDRMCALPYGKIVFVECKRPGGKLTDLQAEEIRKLEALGQDVVVVDTYEKVNMLMIRVKDELKDLEVIENNPYAY